MDAGTLSIKEIYGSDRRILVPLYQRPYVWVRDLQWEPLWDDVRFVAERLLRKEEVRPHFMGAVVLDQMPNKTGHLETRQVIDGQQRLTTIQIILEAFSDICAQYSIDKYDKALLKLTRNDDPMSVDPDDQFKIWPTNADRHHFRQVMLAASPEEVCQLYGKKDRVPEVGHPLPDAYLFFFAQIEDWLTQQEGELDERIAALYTALREQIRMVSIDLDKEDDAQVIFETLNARGTPLLPSDLIKNFLFHRAGPDVDVLQSIYQQYWAPFDQDAKYWRKEIGRGHAKRARIDTYMQHYLTLASKDEVSVGHLYKSFLDQARGVGPEGAELWFDKLSRFAQVFRGFDHAEKGSRKEEFFQRITAMDITTILPFVLGLFSEYESNHPTLLKVLRDLESFLVRRMVCHLSTRGYNRFFIELLSTLTPTNEAIDERVRKKLLSSDAEAYRWPDDKEFSSAWCSRPFFRLFAQSRVRMILEALEKKMRSEKSEALQFQEKLTIEHILPQKWQEHWPFNEEEVTNELIRQREEGLHRIGNLTLLTRRLNPSISNGPWEKKRKEIQKFSALALNQTLAEAGTWSESAIESRSRHLLDVAVRIWPRPQA